MNRFYQILLVVMLLSILTSCNGQVRDQTKSAKESSTSKSQIVGGGCDGCELMYVGLPKFINSNDTSAGWREEGQKLLVTGIVYRLDGKTPASNILIYYWQTNNVGLYTAKQGMEEEAKKHGHIRGWIKTDEEGRYSLYTIRPAPYPNNNLPAHIHFSIKEPDLEEEYYTDDINFDDDKLLIQHLKKYPQENRAGSGIVRVLIKDDHQIAEHDIVLGLNIPNYPRESVSQIKSGLSIGEDQPSFTPFHTFGPDKGTKTCPVCKYGRYHGVIYFVGNHPNWKEVKKWLIFLEGESFKRQKYLKAYFVYGNEKSYNREARQKELEKLGKELNLQKVALTIVPAFSDTESEAHLNKINPEVENTFIIYKHRSIIDKYINFKPTVENFKVFSSTLDRTQGPYFELAEPAHN